MNGLIVLGICVLCSAGASFFLKLGAMTLMDQISLVALFKNIMIWIGGFCYIASFVGYIYALRLVPLSLAQPVITTGVSIVTTLAAVLFMREQMHLINWAGLLLICGGILFLFWGRI